MLINIDELSKEIKVHPNTVFNWIKKGMPCFKKGHIIRFDLDKVMEWLENKLKENK